MALQRSSASATKTEETFKSIFTTARARSHAERLLLSSEHVQEKHEKLKIDKIFRINVTLGGVGGCQSVFQQPGIFRFFW